ncbi:MAG: Quercetin 2,3-dioxygenase [Myxococcaceae bacterium]|nr:Quercetin 2,3-dioxygenase [Myxococcaceae bacterium]
MITLRPADQRGHAEHGWLDSYHTFSFANYYDPQHMGFRSLRVINDDRIAAGRGFGTHPHRDMEIITYVLDGAVKHGDSMGTGSIIRPGDVQRMSAGTGVAHSEANASSSELLHLLQIWIEPSERGIAPSYEQKTFSREEKQGRLRVVASPDGRDGSIGIHADAVLHAGLFDAGESAQLALGEGRSAWVHVARGRVRVNGHELAAGDALAMSAEARVCVEGIDHGEVLVFDLA